MSKPLIDVLSRRRQVWPPVWLMRQAGRYLPEYRAIREKSADFLKLCLTPKLAAEVTLQPIDRFGFDAAILFSDILVVPYALGQRVWFTAGEGPRLDPIENRKDIAQLKSELNQDALAPIYETIDRVKTRLPPRVALLGFCGAPWTVASYMIAGSGTADQQAGRLFAYREGEAFSILIDRLVQVSADYLIRQLQAGVDAVQIFDTWAGTLSADQLQRWCVEPVQQIISRIRCEVPDAKVIGFPRGIGSSVLRYIDAVPIDAIGLDWTIEVDFARDQIQCRIPVQGNLDPVVLLAGGRVLDEAIDRILEALCEGPFIFNLGHGVLPDTPVAHVEQMLKRVRGS